MSDESAKSTTNSASTAHVVSTEDSTRITPKPPDFVLWIAWVLASFRRHPVYAAVVALVLIAGVIGTVKNLAPNTPDNITTPSGNATPKPELSMAEKMTGRWRDVTGHQKPIRLTVYDRNANLETYDEDGTSHALLGTFDGKKVTAVFTTLLPNPNDGEVKTTIELELSSDGFLVGRATVKNPLLDRPLIPLLRYERG